VTRLVYTLAVVAAIAATAVLVEPPARTALSADVQPAQQPTTLWSAPATLSACPSAAGGRVVFPSDSPTHATGSGAIVWSDSSTCPGGEGARVAAIGAGDVPGAGVIPRTVAGRTLLPRAPLTASGAPFGQILIAGVSPTASADGLAIQGLAGGPFSAVAAGAGSAAPTALATAYLGDVALASAPTGGTGADGLRVHVERFFSHHFDRNATVSASGRGLVQALTLALDFRSEALAVWAQGGEIYARVVPNNDGAPHPLRRLARVGPHPRISALLSDDNRAIVAWTEQRGTQTSVYIDRSAVGVRFGSPQLLERFQDPDGLSSPAASPSLVRLSSESVMLAWAGSAADHWVVRAAPVDLDGVGTVSTISAPGVDALLADLAAGPAGDALLVWTEPLPTAAGPPDMERQALFAARGFDAYPEGTMFDTPEEVAPPAPISEPTVALDPNSDRAVAVWRGEASAIEYSIRGTEGDP
jgi:hypothetical protein